MEGGIVNKLLEQDGSIRTFEGALISGPDAERAAIWEAALGIPNKVINEDGSISSLPSGGGGASYAYPQDLSTADGDQPVTFDVSKITPATPAIAVGNVFSDLSGDTFAVQTLAGAASTAKYKPLVIPIATATALGGIKAAARDATKDTLEAKIDAATGKVYIDPSKVDVPVKDGEVAGQSVLNKVREVLEIPHAEPKGPVPNPAYVGTFTNATSLEAAHPHATTPINSFAFIGTSVYTNRAGGGTPQPISGIATGTPLLAIESDFLKTTVPAGYGLLDLGLNNGVHLVISGNGASTFAYLVDRKGAYFYLRRPGQDMIASGMYEVDFRGLILSIYVGSGSLVFDSPAILDTVSWQVISGTPPEPKGDVTSAEPWAPLTGKTPEVAPYLSTLSLSEVEGTVGTTRLLDVDDDELALTGGAFKDGLVKVIMLGGERLPEQGGHVVALPEARPELHGNNPLYLGQYASSGALAAAHPATMALIGHFGAIGSAHEIYVIKGAQEHILGLSQALPDTDYGALSLGALLDELYAWVGSLVNTPASDASDYIRTFQVCFQDSADQDLEVRCSPVYAWIGGHRRLKMDMDVVFNGAGGIVHLLHIDRQVTPGNAADFAVSDTDLVSSKTFSDIAGQGQSAIWDKARRRLTFYDYLYWRDVYAQVPPALNDVPVIVDVIAPITWADGGATLGTEPYLETISHAKALGMVALAGNVDPANHADALTGESLASLVAGKTAGNYLLAFNLAADGTVSIGAVPRA
jgi:hypothetical protein